MLKMSIMNIASVVIWKVLFSDAVEIKKKKKKKGSRGSYVKCDRLKWRRRQPRQTLTQVTSWKMKKYQQNSLSDLCSPLLISC